MLKMVTNTENVFENHSIRGTLYISIDDSKFHVKFYESLKVEISLDEQDHAALHSKSRGAFLELDKSSEKTSTWGDYIDLSALPSFQIIPKTSQKVVKAENGQLVPIIPFNQVLSSKDRVSEQTEVEQIPEPLSEITPSSNDDNASTNKAKKRKISTGNQQTKHLHTLSLSDIEGSGQKSKEAEKCGKNVHRSDNLESSEGAAEEQTYVNDNVLSMEVLNREIFVDNNQHPNESNSNGSFPPVHYCGDCCKTFKTSQLLKDHKKVNKFNDYNCDECCEIFPFKAFLQVHKKSNHGSSGASLVYKDDQYWYSCDDCGALVKTLVKLQIHNLTHTGEGYFQCCLCPEKFGEKTDLRDHIKCHKSNGMIRCRWCNEWFENRPTLAKHKLTCKEIKCHLCDNVFPNKTSRNQHYKDFHPTDILKCEICPYMFSSQEELDMHMMKHSRFKKKQCTLCGLFFSRLKKHMMVHKNPADITENEIFYCDKCPAKFTNQCTFNRHVQSHIGDKPYQCPNCPRTFSNCGVLYKHIKRHASLLPYACEVCGENCESIDHLKTHMLTHSDDNILFPCSVCTQSFMYRTSLETHMQLKHPQSLPANVPVTLAESESLNAAQEISVAAGFGDNPNALMQVVIPGLTDLDDAQGQSASEFEIVIVEKD